MDIKFVHPNKYNPNFMPQGKFDEMRQAIKAGKFYGSIIVRKDGTIIDGEHRWKALKSLGAKKVPCIVEADANDDEAKLITIRMNRERGYLTPVETGNVLAGLMLKIPPDILARKSGIPPSELALLTNMKYDTELDVETVTDKSVAWAKIDALLNKLHMAVKGEKIKRVITVGRGGLVPARLFADRIGAKEILILRPKEKITDDIPSIFVDDIYDSGKTYAKVEALCSANCKHFLFLYMRKGVDLPKNCFAGTETEGHEYVVFPWDRFEFKKNQKTNLK